MSSLGEKERHLYENLGQRISAIRKSKGLSQAQLADRLKISRSSLANLERGRQRLLVNTLVEVAELFECSVDDLLTGPNRSSSASHALSVDEIVSIRKLLAALRPN